MNLMLEAKLYDNENESKLRENLICKVKKVWDEYHLSDDTFYRTVFLYDYQERKKVKHACPRYETMKSWLDEIFSFGDDLDNAERQKQYVWFFEIIAWLMVSMKYFDFEIETPTLRHILKYFKVGKMNLSSDDDSLDSDKIREIQEIVFETVYEYICERQMDLVFRIDWIIPMVTIKHFVDHYKRILPMFEKETSDGGLELCRFSRYFNLDNKQQSEYSNEKMKEFYQKCRVEVLDCIDAISKLCPLIPEYINFWCSDLATAALVVSIKHSLKWLPEEMIADSKKMSHLKLIYSKWIQSVFTSYDINKDMIKILIKKLGVFLERVCQ